MSARMQVGCEILHTPMVEVIQLTGIIQGEGHGMLCFKLVEIAAAPPARL